MAEKLTKEQKARAQLLLDRQKAIDGKTPQTRTKPLRGISMVNSLCGTQGTTDAAKPPASDSGSGG